MRWEEMQQCPDIGATLLGTRVMVAGSNKRGFRFLPPALKEVLERIPKNAHPSDNLGGILAVADYFSRTRAREVEAALTIGDVLVGMIQAHEISRRAGVGERIEPRRS